RNPGRGCARGGGSGGPALPAGDDAIRPGAGDRRLPCLGPGRVTLATLAAAAAELGYPLTGEQLAQFQKYRDLLLRWNERINLTAIRDTDAVETLHFVDSIAGLAALPPDDGPRVVDVGAGGGLPGLALRIARPDVRLTLLD